MRTWGQKMTFFCRTVLFVEIYADFGEMLSARLVFLRVLEQAIAIVCFAWSKMFGRVE